LTAPAVTETAFQAQVVELARICGWRCNHIRRSIGKGRRWTTATSVVGWPDLMLYRPGQFLAVELKTDTGKLTADQSKVLDDLRAAGIDARCWRPADFPEIQATLTRRPQEPT
jgi:hypothetical protein